MQQLFVHSGLRLAAAQTRQFWAFHQLLRERNIDSDLTRLHAFDTMVLKHYIDSALVATLVDLPSPLLDLGSGAGFPGIPLKIVRPDVDVLLGEPRPKRVAFLQEAIRTLDLRGIDVVAHRIGPRFDRPVRGVISRAVETIDATLARVLPWIQPGARILFMKGPNVDAEAATARERYGSEFRLLRDAAYTLGDTTHQRRLLVYERTTVAAGRGRRSSAAVAAVHDDEDDFDLAAEWGAAAGGAGGSSATDRYEDESAGEGDGHGSADSAADADTDTVADSVTDIVAATVTDATVAATDPRDTSGRHVKDITSDTNPSFKLLRAGLDGRGIRKHGRALVAGARIAHEIVRDFPARARAWVTSGVQTPPAFDAPPALAWLRLSPALFQELDPFGTGGPLLWVDVPPISEWTDTDWPPGCTLFVPFQDPENVGAVVRTAAAFGVARVVLLREAANPFHPRSVRAAGSAILRVPLWRGPSIRDVAPQNAPMIALSPGGPDIAAFDFPATFGLLVGLEGPGLPENWRGQALGIPMAAGNESLNAAAATAVALHEWNRRQR